MKTDTLRKNLIIGLMALGVVVGLILILLAFRPQMAQVSTTPSTSMSVIGALQPVQADSAATTDTGDACDRGGATYEVRTFCKEYFQLNHPEVLK